MGPVPGGASTGTSRDRAGRQNHQVPSVSRPLPRSPRSARETHFGKSTSEKHLAGARVRGVAEPRGTEKTLKPPPPPTRLWHHDRAPGPGPPAQKEKCEMPAQAGSPSGLPKAGSCRGQPLAPQEPARSERQARPRAPREGPGELGGQAPGSDAPEPAAWGSRRRWCPAGPGEVMATPPPVAAGRGQALESHGEGARVQAQSVGCTDSGMLLCALTSEGPHRNVPKALAKSVLPEPTTGTSRFVAKLAAFTETRDKALHSAWRWKAWRGTAGKDIK